VSKLNFEASIRAIEKDIAKHKVDPQAQRVRELETRLQRQEATINRLRNDNEGLQIKLEGAKAKLARAETLLKGKEQHGG
jgi:outer membrane murein-binding lipoprotein Lpp